MLDIKNPETQTRSIDERLQEHFEREFSDRRQFLRISQQYRREGYVKISNLVPDDLKEQISAETRRLVDDHGRRIDITLKETSNSARKMTTVSCKHIAAEGDLIPQVYYSQPMMSFLSRVAHERVQVCPWEGERFIITKQHNPGDTHGWHWGDFSFTVIWIIEAPAIEVGGTLQCVPHTDWDKSDPRVDEYLLDNPIRSYYNQTGDIYFLRSNTTLHRTVPLTQPTTRIILNTCWGSEMDTSLQSGHETMEAMFD
jgi:hypothetical protein